MCRLFIFSNNRFIRVCHDNVRVMENIKKCQCKRLAKVSFYTFWKSESVFTPSLIIIIIIIMINIIVTVILNITITLINVSGAVRLLQRRKGWREAWFQNPGQRRGELSSSFYNVQIFFKYAQNIFKICEKSRQQWDESWFLQIIPDQHIG